jgi:hypothetical protein
MQTKPRCNLYLSERIAVTKTSLRSRKGPGQCVPCARGSTREDPLEKPSRRTPTPVEVAGFLIHRVECQTSEFNDHRHDRDVLDVGERHNILALGRVRLRRGQPLLVDTDQQPNP